MIKISIAAVCVLLALTACAPVDGVSQISEAGESLREEAAQTEPESSREETTQPFPESEPDVTLAENRVAAITPANAERIRKKSLKIRMWWAG